LGGTEDGWTLRRDEVVSALVGLSSHVELTTGVGDESSSGSDQAQSEVGHQRVNKEISVMTTSETSSSVREVPVAGGVVQVALTDSGHGRAFLLLHGGGGPQTVARFADMLATKRQAHVITPTHPGFAGTQRPDSLTSIQGLAALYAGLLDELDLAGVTVVGNSIGGWIAAEMALLDTPRVSAFVLVDATGLEVPGHPIADFFSVTARQLAELSYHDPDKFGIDPTKLAPEALKAMAGNRATLGVYAGTSMNAAGLAGRLAGVTKPTLVVWGDCDRIVDPDYGRAYAEAIPGARFQLLADTGHLPQIETPDRLLDAIWTFAESHALLRP
jgi:pimeloyl-ACP methyl ester carboxylesterase